MVWAGGALCLLAALLLAACGGESEPDPVEEPVAAAQTPTPEQPSPSPTATPEPEPTPTPTATPTAAKPYSDQSEGESQFNPDLAFDFDEDSVWGEVFDAIAEPERLCIENELGDEVLASARDEHVLSDAPTQPWQVGVFGCLAPETAATVFLSRMIVEVSDLMNSGVETCIRDLLVQTDLVAMVESTLPDADGSDAGDLSDEFTIKLFMCMAQATVPEDVIPHAETQQPIWSYATGGWVVNAPAVVDGMVFVGSDDNHIYALDAGAGEVVWRYETGDVIRSTPTVYEGTVYAGSNDGSVHALRAETGEALWTFSAGRPVQYAPIAGGGLVYVGANSTGDFAVHALDAATGDPAWIAEAPYPYGAPFAVAVAEGMLYAPGESGELYALDASTGELAWSFDAGMGAELPPTVVDGVAYLTSVNTAYALDAATGEELWSFGTDRFPARNFPALVVDGAYYFSPDNHLYALNVSTGMPRWTYEADAMIVTAPVVADGLVFAGSESGRFFALDAVFGQIAWTWDAPDVALASPSVIEGVLYAESSDGNLRAFRAWTGEELWTFQKGYFDGVPSYAVADGTLFIGSLDGAVYAFPALSADFDPVSKLDPPGFTQAMVRDAVARYQKDGRDAAVAYYSSPESVDGQWYVFIIDEEGYTIAHPNPDFIGRDPGMRVDPTGYVFGDDLLAATELGRWIDYVAVNPATGENALKHTWAVLHDGLVFASGWYEE